jgi:hypothetical protein
LSIHYFLDFLTESDTMKKLKQLVLSLLLVASSNVSNASIYTFTDVVDPDPDVLISFGNHKSYSYTHNILDDGYNVLTDSIISASLVLNFRDESTDAAAESVSFTFDLSPFGTQIITSGGATFTTTFSGLALSGLLSPDGILNVTLDNAGTTNGHQVNRSDFLFLDSTLIVTADGTSNEDTPIQLAQAVPEPVSLALMGIGLAGMGWTSRKRKAAKR